MRRPLTFVAALVLIAAASVVEVRAEPAPPTLPLCSEDDRPEEREPSAGRPRQLQGDVPRAHRVEGTDGVSRAEQGYNCGLSLVGHAVLDQDGRNPTGNANMAWAGDCAYVAGPGTTFGPARYEPSEDDPNGIAVVDVRNPKRPVHTKTLDGRPGSTQALETLYAVEAPHRSILVVGQYGNFGSGDDKPMDVYDVTGRKCADPEFKGTVVWPENIHNLTISGNGRYVFATQPLQVVDIDPLFDDDPATGAEYLGNLEDVLPYPLVSTRPYPDLDDGLPAEVREARKDGYSAHQVWSNHDGTRIYIGGQLPTYEVFSIVDLTHWLQRTASREPVGPPKVLSQRTGRGHSVSKATIRVGGVLQEWVLHAEESVFNQAWGCVPEELNPFAGPAQPWLSNVSDPRDPTMHVSQFGLEINRRENCAAQRDSGVQASVHYHDFDREHEARFAILAMQNAGIRVVDVRDPAAPVEVAYFNPADVDAGPEVRLDYAWAHSRYKDGNIWFATRSGGFWVVELGKQVRDYFGIGGKPLHASGRPGTLDANLAALSGAPPLAPVFSCTYGAVART